MAISKRPRRRRRRQCAKEKGEAIYESCSYYEMVKCNSSVVTERDSEGWRERESRRKTDLMADIVVGGGISTGPVGLTAAAAAAAVGSLLSICVVFFTRCTITFCWLSAAYCYRLRRPQKKKENLCSQVSHPCGLITTVLPRHFLKATSNERNVTLCIIRRRRRRRYKFPMRNRVGSNRMM